MKIVAQRRERSGCNRFFGFTGGRRRIGSINIRADVIREFLGHRRSANQNFYAVANASRTCMPDEKFFSLVSRNLVSPANSRTESRLFAISFSDSPMMVL